MGPGDVALATPGASPQQRRTRWILEWVVIILFAFLAAFILRLFFFQTFYIPSASMYPTLQVGDRILVSKISVELGTINRGDILVFRRPPNEDCGGAQVNDLVKRVIGLPNEMIWSSGQTIYINGTVLKQPWTHEPLGSTPITKQRIPKDSYFMMGDNEGLSCDSRYWGPIQHSYIVGKVFFRIWPFSRMGFL